MADVVETFTFQAEVNQRSSFVGNSSDASDKDKAISFFHTWSHFALSMEVVVTQALSNFDRQSKSPFSYLSISMVDLYSPLSFEFFDEFVSGMFDATLNPSSRSSEVMAMKLQKVCKSFRKWRKLVDSAVIAKELWWIFVMSTSKKFYVSKKKNRRRKGERERLRIVAMASLRLRRQESSPRQQDSLRSPEAELGVKVEDLWDVLEPQLSPTKKLNACFEGIPVSAFPLAPSSQLIEIKSDTSLAEAVEIMAQNKILSAPVVDVNASEDASWMDRYIGIVEFAGIVV
ncbi:uncharacterized protein LOC123202490 [Mangifera indica]|uniref:uncharacterized protein LOC123202489 n=1 Tax=Mangifera indica TaxID=29780 RepID=UPI001CFBDBAB|nr:uncharacterized protein LOC123202489 [Mangifera indica]XP_044474389.1 uncharacterized protein LOC123202490 [Mangifera indica]